MSKGFASNYRIWLLALGLILCFGGIGARRLSHHGCELGRGITDVGDLRFGAGRRWRGPGPD